MISSQKSKLANQDDESDTGARARIVPAHASAHPTCARASAVDAFIALGGNADKTGEISTEKLRGIVKEFGLTIDIDVRAAPRPRGALPAARADSPWLARPAAAADSRDG